MEQAKVIARSCPAPINIHTSDYSSYEKQKQKTKISDVILFAVDLESMRLRFQMNLLLY